VTPERWQRVQEVLHEALELPPPSVPASSTGPARSLDSADPKGLERTCLQRRSARCSNRR
jgi:hypothetical protein